MSLNENNSPKRRLTLASGSPRRRELIKALDLDVEITTSNVEEGDPLKGESSSEYVKRLALSKAKDVAKNVNAGIVLGADTTVVLNGEVLGKPRDAEEAVHMLKKLRGRPHIVSTGVAVVDADSGRCVSSVKSTDVMMRDYSDKEIAAYVASGEPMDKAGAYAAQDIDFRPAQKIIGCYTNVVGLPICDVLELLGRLGSKVTLRQSWQIPDECLDCPLKAEEKAVRA